MAGTEQKREANRVSLPMNTLRRDLLKPLVGGSQFPGGLGEAMRERGEEVEVELSLGLSLNGRFGVDPQRDLRLFRSSSVVSDYMVVSGGGEDALLMRTVSLPTEMETEAEAEERKRKEAQPQRRVEAKKKRVEMLSNVMRPQDQVALFENAEENVGAQTHFSPPIDSRGHVLRHFGQTTWACEAIGGSARAQSVEGLPLPLSHTQGSVVSLGSGSSGVSEFESHPIQGMNKYTTESVSPASVHSHPVQNKQKPGLPYGKIKKTVRFSENLVETLPARSVASENGGDEMAKNAMLDMPCVSTTGEGPNGKTIQGFLYQYRKGEEVRIVCVCHGDFLSPAEFVRHAGGRDVAHPLRQIVVNHSPLV